MFLSDRTGIPFVPLVLEFEAMVNKQFQLAEFARDYIKTHPDYELFSFDNSISVCFNFKSIPAKLLCTKLYKDAKLMVGFGKFKNEDFVRMVTINSLLEEKDILNFFNIIEASF